MKQFVYATEEIGYPGGIVNKYEVGIVEKLCAPIAKVTFVCNHVTIELDVDKVVCFNLFETGDQFSKKVCNVCNRLLDVEMFEKNQNGKDNRTVRRPSCRECRVTINGVDMTARDKKQMNKIKPHLEIWMCPVCKKTTIPGLTSKVVCDHDHKTGRPRAWICDSCNTGLGRFKDDISLLKNAIDYLKENEE